jgi:hypothetical protein
MGAAKWGLVAILALSVLAGASQAGDAAWIPSRHPNFQLDGGVNLGLNNETPAA